MPLSKKEMKKAVLDRYAAIARQKGAPSESCCSEGGTCSDPADAPVDSCSARLGYSLTELRDIPAGADMGLGSGNPITHAELKEGEIVLDLGSGGGIDCFLAAKKVGETGKVIGVDMTDDMLEAAGRNAQSGGFDNVTFVKGEIEELPVENASVDVVISNCVINLAPEKKPVYGEIARVLRPGGRMVISDILASEPLPAKLREDPDLICGCTGGAAVMDQLRQWLDELDFTDTSIEPDMNTRRDFSRWVHGEEGYVVSAIIKAFKPIRRQKMDQTEQIKDNVMDEKVRELIAIGASVAAHCQPCLTFHVNRAAGLCIDEQDIQKAMAVGESVSKGAAAAIKRHGAQAVAERERPACCTQQDAGNNTGETTEGNGCCG